MAEFPALPLWTDAYLGDTIHLTTIEHGAYMLLLMAMWRNDGALPDDDKVLARYARLTSGQWARIAPTIRKFFRAVDGTITQGRLTDELNHVRQHSRKQSNAAKSRWLKTNDTCDATAMPDECHGNAPTPTPRRKEEAKASSQKRGSRLQSDWRLPKAWGEWATEAGMSELCVRREADRFKDYWLSVPGSKGVKLDWQATWRNWVRKSLEDTASTQKAAAPKYGDRRQRKDGTWETYHNPFDGWMRSYG